MASPWNFLSRLVSPRRQKGRGDEQVDRVNLEKPETGGVAERLAGESLDSVDLPGAESSRRLDPTDDLTTPHVAPGQAVDHPQDTIETDGSNVEDGSEAAPAKRKRRTRKVESVVDASKASPAVVATSDEEISLDDEIRALRGQLVRKLRQQNAQLKKMLERFER